MLGLWVQHERHGFDYNNKVKVKSQLDNFRKEVNKYKNHPSLLIWVIGNEYELNYTNTKVWAAVNDIDKMIHEEDVNHHVDCINHTQSDQHCNRGFEAFDIPHHDARGELDRYIQQHHNLIGDALHWI